MKTKWVRSNLFGIITIVAVLLTAAAIAYLSGDPSYVDGLPK